MRPETRFGFFKPCFHFIVEADEFFWNEYAPIALKYVSTVLHVIGEPILSAVGCEKRLPVFTNATFIWFDGRDEMEITSPTTLQSRQIYSCEREEMLKMLFDIFGENRLRIRIRTEEIRLLAET